MESKRPVGQRSYETQLLVDRLKALEPGELITYAELSSIAGVDVHDRNGHGVSRLDTARRIVEAEAGFLVGPDPGVGIKRLTPIEQAALAVDSLTRLRRSNRKRLRRLSLVEYAKLNAEQQQKHNLAASVFGVVELFTRRKSLERISGAVEKETAKLAIGNTLALFSEAKK